MIDPLAPYSLPRLGLSRQALLTVVVLHIAVLWWALQGEPAQRATRQVVMQYFSPITQIAPAKPSPPPEAPALKITEALPTAAPQVTPPPPPPPPVAQPVPEPVAPPPPAPILQKLEPIAAPRANFKIQDIKAPTENRRTPDVAATRIEPVLAPVPVIPTLEQLAAPAKTAPLPEALPTQKLPNLPDAQLPKLAEPVAQLPTPVPVIPDPVVPPAPAAAPVPTPVPVATPTPVPTPGPAPVPGAAPRAAAITPVEQRPAAAGTGAAGGGGSAAQPPAANPGGSAGFNYNLRPTVPGARQKTAAELAREQQGGNGSKNKLAGDMDAAAKPDCADSGGRASLLSAVVIAANVITDKCK